MRYEQARRQGPDVRTALLHTTTHVAVGNLTAAATLALAFFAAMFADFQAVAELGWIAGCGVLLCAFACFTVLPALLMLFDRRHAVECRATTERRHDSGICARDSGSECLAAGPGCRARPWAGRWRGRGALTVVLGVLRLCASPTTTTCCTCRPSDLDSVRWEMTLIEHTAGASWHALSYTDTPEEALALKARYEKLPEVSRVVEVASLVPPDQDAKLPLLADIQHRLRNLPRARQTDSAHQRPGTRRPAARAWPSCFSRWPAHGPAADGAATTLLAELRRAALSELQTQLRLHADAGGRRRSVCRSSTSGWPATWPRTCTGCAMSPRRQPITLADLPPALRERYVGQQRQMAAARLRQGLPVGLRAAGAFHAADPDRRSRGDRQTVRHGRRAEGDEERLAAGRHLRLAGHRRGAVARFPQSADTR